MAKTSPTIRNLIDKHPLQRLNSPSRGVSAFVHLLGLLSFASSFQYLVTHPNHINSSYGWHFQYLTIIGLALTTLTFVLALLSDTLLSAPLFRLKTLLTPLTTPLSVLITLLYWSLWLIDASLVVPPELELPLLPDLGFHFAPAAFSVVDLLLLSPPWTVGVLPATALSVGFAVGYWVWIEVCYGRNGFYPYPLFELLNTWGRVGVFGASALVMVAMMAGLGWVYGMVNGIVVQEEKGMGKERERPGKVKREN